MTSTNPAPTSSSTPQEGAPAMTTTADNIAAIIRHDHGVDPDVAAEAVEYYLAWMEGLHGRAIDRDAVDDLDAGFVEIAFAVDQHKREVAAAGGAR